MKEENGTTTIPILGPEDLDEKGEPTEYAMIELNGELLSPTEIPTTEKVQEILGGTDRVELGRLKLGPNDTTPVMILGSHELKGKVENLKESLCVMQKNFDGAKDIESYMVVGIIKKKLIFNQYPKVIMR